MGMVTLGILAPLPQPSPPPIPAVTLTSNAETDRNLKDNTSSSIFLIILILPVVIFLAGLVLMLYKEVSHILRPTDRDPDDREGHLQQLFHLHDSGMDQCFIDSLPVFLYKAIIGLRDPFDCAVCLCGFEADDKLRLLPKCGHAFHVECIDTWLLCHSTCPLCRKTLLPDFSTSNGSSPAYFVLDTLSESSSPMEVASDKMGSVLNVPVNFPGEDVIGTSDHKCSPNPWETGDKQDMGSAISEASGERMVSVKLGKFQTMDLVAGEGEGSSGGINNLNERRCLSMGSYKYAVDENSLLQVAIRLPKQKSCITNLGYRLAMSEGDCDLTSKRFKDFDSPSQSEPGGYGASAGTCADEHKDSFSFPKILLRPMKEREIAEDCSRRASSFQLPLYQVSAESKPRCDDSLSSSEFDISGWEKRESEMGLDVEIGSCNNSRDS